MSYDHKVLDTTCCGPPLFHPYPNREEMPVPHGWFREVAARAIAWLTYRPSRRLASCICIEEAAYELWLDVFPHSRLDIAVEYSIEVTRHYARHVGAQINTPGFFFIKLHRNELPNYRLEMLYYFWMANQDM